MSTNFDEMRQHVQKVYRVNRESQELQGVPSEILEMMRDAAMSFITSLEIDVVGADEIEAVCSCCGGGSGGGSGIVGEPQ